MTKYIHTQNPTGNTGNRFPVVHSIIPFSHKTFWNIIIFFFVVVPIGHSFGDHRETLVAEVLRLPQRGPVTKLM